MTGNKEKQQQSKVIFYIDRIAKNTQKSKAYLHLKNLKVVAI